jgi:DNA-binding transcriptional LysR family regulator
MLDLESVRLFVLSVELGNFTRAAEAVGTVQPVVSQRVKQLETVLGRKLLARTPRFLRTTADGALFLPRARDLLAAHDKALGFSQQPSIRFAFAVSDHALGASVETLLRRARAVLPPDAEIEAQLGFSQEIRALFDQGRFDAVFVRRAPNAAEGETIGLDPVGWRASPDWSWRSGEPIALATLGEKCGVRASAVRQLEKARLPWREAFVAGSCSALMSFVRAGLGVAPMGRLACGGVPDRGPELGLPALPESEIALFARAQSPQGAQAIRALTACMKASLLS